MTEGASSLGRFVLCTFLWLVPCFAAWYVSAQYHAALAGGLARAFVEVFKPGLVSELERSRSELVFVTTLELRPAPGQTAVVLAEVNPLIYSYGLGLFVALMLATRAQWWKILVGAAVLLPFQAWGIAFDFLSQVAVRLGPEVAEQARMFGWRSEAIALGYQIGSLIFPSLMPVVLWALFSRQFIEGLLHRTDGRS